MRVIPIMHQRWDYRNAGVSHAPLISDMLCKLAHTYPSKTIASVVAPSRKLRILDAACRTTTNSMSEA
jgi:hypothetical protein